MCGYIIGGEIFTESDIASIACSDPIRQILLAEAILKLASAADSIEYPQGTEPVSAKNLAEFLSCISEVANAADSYAGSVDNAILNNSL